MAPSHLRAALLAFTLAAGVFVLGQPLLAAARGGAGDVCPYRARTGRDCLGCGGTRAFAAARQGDWAAAWNLNPLGAASAAGALLVAAGAVLTLAARHLLPLAIASGASGLLVAAAFAARLLAWMTG